MSTTEDPTRDHQRQSGAALSAFRSELPNRVDREWSASIIVRELEEALLVRTQKAELRQLTTADVEEELNEQFHRRLQQMIRELTQLQKSVEDAGSPQTKAAASLISLRDAPRPILSIQQEERVSSCLGGLHLPAWLLTRQIRKGLIDPLLPEIRERVRVMRKQTMAWTGDALEALTEQQERQEIEFSRPSLPRNATVSTPEQQTALKELQDWIAAVPMEEMQR